MFNVSQRTCCLCAQLDLKAKCRGDLTREAMFIGWDEFSSEGAVFSLQTSLPERFYFTKGRHFKEAMIFCDTGTRRRD